MDTQMNRRQALGALGAVSLSTLLAACGDDETPSGSVTTTQGTTSTVETKTSTDDLRRAAGFRGWVA